MGFEMLSKPNQGFERGTGFGDECTAYSPLYCTSDHHLPRTSPGQRGVLEAVMVVAQAAAEDDLSTPPWCDRTHQKVTSATTN